MLRSVIQYFFNTGNNESSPDVNERIEPSESSSIKQEDKKLTLRERLDETGCEHKDIPDEYIDFFISHQLMNNPVMVDGYHVMDYDDLLIWWETSGKKNINPATSSAIGLNEDGSLKIVFMTTLKQNIEDFVLDQEQFKKNKLRLKALEDERSLLTQQIMSCFHQPDSLKIHLRQLDNLNDKINKLTNPHSLDEDKSASTSPFTQLYALLKKQEEVGELPKDQEILENILQKIDAKYQVRPIKLEWCNIKTEFSPSIHFSHSAWNLFGTRPFLGENSTLSSSNSNTLRLSWSDETN